VAIAVLFTLCFSAIAEYYNMQTVWPDFLSGQHIIVKIQQWQEDNSVTVKTEDLINYCKSRGDDFIIYKDFPFSHGRAVYLSGNTLFSPELIEGRNFKNTDFVEQTPTVLVSEDLSEKCVLKNGKEYFLHENHEYEVIGKYKIPPSRKYAASWDKSSALYFVNMAASFETNLSTPLNGDYIVDAKEKSIEFLKDLTSLIKTINPDNINIDVGEAVLITNTQNIQQTIKNSMPFIIVFFLTAFLILLNISSITNYWIEGRKKEILIRMLSGGKPSTIRWMILRDYLLIATIGYGLGLLLAIIAIWLGILSFIGKNIYPLVVIAGYITCITLGAIAGFVYLTIKLKQNIILQMRE